VRRFLTATTALGLLTTLIAATFSTGCESVPEIRFVAEDARADAPTGDGGGNKLDGSGGDASGCTGPSPSGGARCCGAVWCEGQCDDSRCADCAQEAVAGKCQQRDLCCAKVGNVQCKAQCP
jgi:hypothetical protein